MAAPTIGATIATWESTGDAQDCTQSHTLDSNTTQLLVFIGDVTAGGASDPTAVKWGGSSGTNLTKIWSAATGAITGSLWSLLSPGGAATQDIFVDWPGDNTSSLMNAINIINGPTSSPFRDQSGADYVEASGSTAAIDIGSIASSSTDLCIGFVSFRDRDNNPVTEDSGQTSIFHNDNSTHPGNKSNAAYQFASYEDSPTSTVALGWDGSDDWGWVAVGFSIVEAAPAGPPIPPLVLSGSNLSGIAEPFTQERM